MKKATRHKFEYILLRTFEIVLTPMSDSMRRQVSTLFGLVIWYVAPFRKKVVMDNLVQAFPEKKLSELKQIAKKCYVHFAGLYLEMFSSFKLPEHIFFQRVKNSGRSVIDDVLSRGKGMIMVMFHFGNWEVAGDWFNRSHYYAAAVARRQRNPWVNEKIIRTRLTNGGILYYTDEDTIKMMRMVKNNGLLCLVADQDAGKNGIFVPFFGRPSSSFRGPALLTKRLRCPLVAATCLKQEDGTYHMTAEEIHLTGKESMEDVIAGYTAYFEAMIRQHPEQYYWFHRRWKSKPKSN